MREITVRIYDYDELSPASKIRALEEWQSEDIEHFWGREVKDTFDKLQKELGIKVTQWEYTRTYHDSGVIRFTNYTDDQLDLKGRRAQAFLWNRFSGLIVQPRMEWYSKNKDGRVDLSGRQYCGDGWKNMRRESKIFFDRTYDGTCPLTGVCFDCYALDPLVCFCLGVEWDEKAKRLVMIPQSKRAMWAATTVEDVLRDCVDALLRSAQDDWNYQFTEKYFADHARNNGFAFDENGHRRVRPVSMDGTRKRLAVLYDD